MAAVNQLLKWKAEGRAEGLAEGMALGMQEGQRNALLKVLRVRFPDAPYDLMMGIRGMTDLDQMIRWLEVALVAPTIDLFRVMAADSDRRGLR